MTDIRISRDHDVATICEVHKQAFGEEEGEEIAELVRNLFIDQTTRPSLSLVAENDGAIVGHVLFTAVQIEQMHRPVSARILAPLGVLPAHQNTGIGSALVRDGLERLRAAEVDLVFVLGHPAYYPRFGFRPAYTSGLMPPQPIPKEHHDAWMVGVLSSDDLEDINGTVTCAQTLNDPKHW